MKHKKLLAGGGALLALALMPASVAFAGSTPITVRVEGVKHELLAPTDVKAHSGSLTRFGAPTGKCSDDSAAGALDQATHHNWKGTWESSFGDYEITSILGETHTFASKKDYWEVFVNDVAAQTGACEIKLKPGEQILFAAVPQKGPSEAPLLVEAPRRARVGTTLTVQVRERAGRRVVPVQGAEVSGGGLHGRTNRGGFVRLTPTHTGRLTLVATRSEFVRGEATIDIH
jgi:hypothetical protein